MEKLDSFSKILLATGAINYMAASLNSVTQQIAFIPKNVSETAAESVIRNNAELDKVLVALKDTMENFGNFMDGIDCVCPIDVRIYEVPFDIILHGNDNVED